MQMIREECFEDGISLGEKRMLIKLLRMNVELSDELEQKIVEEIDEAKINKCANVIMQVQPERIIDTIKQILSE